jgi:hypothetical protein
MNDEYEWLCKEAIVTCLNLLSRNQPAGAKEKSLKTSKFSVSRPRFERVTF